MTPPEFQTDLWHETLIQMDRYGGHFVCALAAAWRLADKENSDKLHVAFARYWDKYEAMAREAGK